MKTSGLSFVLLLFVLFATAQNTTRDSLEAVIKQENKLSEKLKAYNALAGLLNYSEPDTAIFYARQVLKLATVHQAKDRALAYAKLALIHKNIGQYAQALSFADSAFKYYENDSVSMASVLNTVGTVNYYLSDYQKAALLYRQAYEIYLKAGLMDRAATLLNNTALAYSEMSNYSKALDQYFEALKVHEASQNDLGKSLTLSNIGIVYFDLGNLDKALDYYFQSLEIREKLGDEFGIASVSSNIGNALATQGNYEAAKPYFERASSIFESTKDLVNLAAVYAQIGHYQLANGEEKEGIKTLKQALHLHKQTGALQNEAYVLISLGDYYVKNNQLQEAFDAFDEAATIFNNTGNRQMYAWALEGLSRYYEKAAAPAKALDHYKRFAQIKDSLHAIESSQRIQAAELRYEGEKKQTKIELLTREKTLQQVIADKNLQGRNFFIIISLLAVLAMLLLGMRFRTKNRFSKMLSLKNQELAKSQEEIDYQKRQLEKQNKQLTLLDAAKTRFFANISHEFRTPLTLIKGPLDHVLKENKEELSEDAENKLMLASKNIQQLSRLTDQLLDLSKLKSGKMPLRTAHTELNALVRRITGNFYSAIPAEKNIQFHIDTKQPKIFLYLDQEKIEQVLNNLISNAIKAIPKEGEITIKLIHDDEPDQHQAKEVNYAHISIADTGIGIREEELPQLFNRFFRSDDSQLQGHRGTGIGLEYSRELIELHGGSITVESVYGKGSTFTVSLPMGKDHLESAEIIEPVIAQKTTLTADQNKIQKDLSAREPSTENEKILVVEDHPEMRAFIVEQLSRHYQIVEAGNGQEALKLLETNQFDLIVSDLMMPELDGISLLKKVRSKAATEDLPFILLTAKAGDENRLEGLSCNADAYITKPFNPEELLISMHNLLENRKRLTQKLSKKVLNIELENDDLLPADQQFLVKTREIVLQNLSHTDFSIADLAESVFLSERQFRRKLKELTGLSPHEFLRQIRLMQAKAHLEKQSFNTISEVAIAVGFSNPAYFSKLFRKFYGKNPQDILPITKEEKQ